MPEIEEREAAVFCGYTWKEWKELAMPERVDGVAHFRIRRYVDLNVEDARGKEAEKQAKKAKRKR